MKTLAAALPPLVPVSVGALTAALDGVLTPTFVVQADGHLIFTNRAGDDMIQSGGALRLRYDRLVTRRAKENPELAAMLSRVAASRRAELLRLLGRNAIAHMLITIRPTPEAGVVTVGVVDLRPADAALAGWFQRAFQLTTQNAELAAGLQSGLSLSAFSERNGITLGATQTRLKKLFARTGTTSQSALIAVLIRAAAIALPS